MSTIDNGEAMVINKKTYKDYVIDYIYSGLREGRLQPGDQVLESHLASHLEISRAPIREALQQLVGEGLLDYKPQVGTFVRILSAKEIMDAYLTRGLLEGYVVADGRERLTEADLDHLAELCQKMESYAVAARQQELIDAGREFHAMLFNQSENVQLIDFTERLSSKLHLLFYKHWASLYDPESIRQRHEALLSAIRTADAVVIESAFRQHYAETGAKVATLYQNEAVTEENNER